MEKPRVIIADTDSSYIIPLQLRFIEAFFEKVDLETVTDKAYFKALFSTPQKADILIVSETLYDRQLCKHDIGKIFLMTEQYEEAQTDELSVNRIFKYTSIKEIFAEVMGKSADGFKVDMEGRAEPQIIFVGSASGGVGKTTLALGISAALTLNYKRVLYINAGYLQSFQSMLDNRSPITSSEVYAKLAALSGNEYSDVKHAIRQEIFSYIPPFKASLMSLNLDYGIYERLALGARQSGDYDYIIVDSDADFEASSARLMDIADKVILVTKQSRSAVFATNLLVANINGIRRDKYIFICNDFDQAQDNALVSADMALKFTVSDYVEHFSDYDRIKLESLSKENSIQRVAVLLI